MWYEAARHMIQLILEETKRSWEKGLRLYVDNCSGHNKNRALIAMAIMSQPRGADTVVRCMHDQLHPGWTCNEDNIFN